MLHVLQLPEHSFTLVTKKTFPHSLPLTPLFLVRPGHLPHPSLGRLQWPRYSVYSFSSECGTNHLFPSSDSNFHAMSYIARYFYTYTCASSLPNPMISPWKMRYFTVSPTSKVVLKNPNQTRQVVNNYVLTTTSSHHIKISFTFPFPQRYHGQCQSTALCF